MRKIFVGLLIGVIGGISSNLYANNYRYGQTQKQLDDKFSDFGYELQQGSRTTSNPNPQLAGNATFYGYATDYSIKLATGDVLNSFARVWITAGSSNTMVSSTQTYYAGDNTFQQMFAVPLDSPTVMNIILSPNTQMQLSIGGLKRDNPNP